MSDILKNNLNYISLHNESLCSKLSEISEYTKNIDLKTNLIGEYNLLINGIPVHSITGAQEEAKAISSLLPYDLNGAVNTIYGIGLGYLADEFVNNAKGTVIVYEPDLEVLHFVLSVVDFSQNFKTKRLFISSNLHEYEKIIYNTFKLNSKVSLSCIDYYKTRCRQDYETFSVWLKRKIELVEHNYLMQIHKTFTFFESTAADLDKKYSMPFLTDYKDFFEDKPAIIVSAGPSLNKNIETLKKYKDNAIVFCVGTALRSLYNNDITPDFLNVVETVNTSIHYNVPISKDINFIAAPYTERSFFDIEFKRRFMTVPLETDAPRWFLEKAEKDFVHFETKGTVAYHALFSAYYLGCNPIILVGQDLAYPEGECYAKGSKFDGLQCVLDEETQKYKIAPKNYEEYKNSFCDACEEDEKRKKTIVDLWLKNLNDRLQFVKGQNDNVLPTDGVYSLFIDYLQEFSADYGKERTLINSSLGGAMINGFDVVPLEDAFKKYADTPLDKKSLIDSMDEIKSCDNTNLIKNLKEDAKDLKTVLVMLQEGFNITSKLEELLTSKDVITPKAEKYIDTLERLFTAITNKYTLKSRIIKMITLYDYCAVSYYQRENKLKTLSDYFKSYGKYFIRNFERAASVQKLLEESIVKLEEKDESSIAKS